MKYPLMRNNILREDLDAVIAHLQTPDPILTQSTHVREFEDAWSAWLGVKHSVFVNSGASANFISMAALKARRVSGQVIVPALTWVSDIASVLHFGFEPVFVDIDPQTLSMSSEQVLSRLNSNTVAVFLTHAQGFNGLSDELLVELDRRNIVLIEDVCESHGARHRGVRLGNYGWLSNFSFYYAHHMSTIEGGMICTNDSEIYEHLRMMRSHGMVREVSSSVVKDELIEANTVCNPEFIFQHAMFNMRNTEIGGILGKSQLLRLDNNILLRNRNKIRFLDGLDAELYQTDFRTLGMSNYAFNLILRPEKIHLVDILMELMRKSGIEFRRGSAGGGNQLRQPYLRDRFPAEYYRAFPITEHIHSFGFYIGNYPDMSISEVDELVEILNGIGR